MMGDESDDDDDGELSWLTVEELSDDTAGL